MRLLHAGGPEGTASKASTRACVAVPEVHMKQVVWAALVSPPLHMQAPRSVALPE